MDAHSDDPRLRARRLADDFRSIAGRCPHISLQWHQSKGLGLRFQLSAEELTSDDRAKRALARCTNRIR